MAALATEAGAQTAFGLGSTQADDARAIAVDGAGNSYITGRFRLTIDFDPGPGVASLSSVSGFSNYVASYDASGALRYAFVLDGGGNVPERGIAVDGSGNVYVTGYFAGVVDFDPGSGVATLNSGTGGNLFVASYDPTGGFRWAFNLAGDDPAVAEAGTAIAVDLAGNSYLTGEFSGETDFDPSGAELLLEANGTTDAFVASYDTNGGLRFAVGFGGTQRDQGLGIAIDGSGNSYVTGSFRDTADFDPGPGVQSLVSAGNRDVFLASYTDAGGFRYALGVGDAFDDVGYGVAVDAAGNAFATGRFLGTADFDPGAGVVNRVAAGNGDIFLASYTSTGALRFAHGFGQGNDESGYAADVDANGRVYITGFFPNALDFDPGPGVALLDPVGTDTFVAIYENSGAFVDAYSFESNSSSSSIGYGLALDATGRAYVTGTFSGGNDSVDFDPGPGSVRLDTVGSTDFYVSSLGPAQPVPALGPLGIGAAAILLGWLGARRAGDAKAVPRIALRASSAASRSPVSTLARSS
ncbi:MAG: hypothetical protein R3F21_15470 [Myxococcota bacterium]